MQYIIYHQRKHSKCPDGWAAAWIASKMYPYAEIIGWQYQTPPPQFLQANDEIIIVDFSFPGDVIQQWLSNQVKVLLIDHHKTAEEELQRFSIESFAKMMQEKESRIVFDMNECGATLTWKYLFPNKPMPPFLKYIRDRDLWKFDYPETRAVHEAMAHLGRTFELYDNLEALSEAKLLEFLLPIGNKLLVEKHEKCLKAVERSEIQTIAGYQVPVVKVTPSEERLVSEICEIMYKDKYPDALFVACLTTDGRYELRSNNQSSNFDVGSFARQFGGGGMFHAAGFDSGLVPGFSPQ